MLGVGCLVNVTMVMRSFIGTYLIDYFSNTYRLCEVIEVDRDFDWLKSNK